MAVFRTSIQKQWQYAKRHKEFEKHRHDLIKVFKQEPEKVFSQLTDQARKLFNIYSQVMREIESLFWLLRLEVNKHGLLYTQHTPVHEIEDCLVYRFSYRFPMFVVALESKRGCFVAYKNRIKKYNSRIESIIRVVEKEFPISEILKNVEKFDPSLWKSFVDSQSDTSSPRPELFKKQIPKKYHSIKTLEYEIKLHRANKELGEFFE